MNVLEKKREEYHAKIREIGSRIRVQGLDQEKDDPETNAMADALVEKYGITNTKEGILFAGYLAEMADPGCKECSGKGAVSFPKCKCKGKFSDGVFTHVDCHDGVVFSAYDSCPCAREGEKRRRREAQEAAPAAVVTSTKKADLDRKISQAEEVLAAAVKRKDEATSSVDQEIAEIQEAVRVYQEKRAEHEQAIVAASGIVRSWDIEIEGFREKIRRAEAGKVGAKEEEARRVDALAAFNEENKATSGKKDDLTEKRNKIARHYEPKIARAMKTLRRLKYLRGDVEETSVSEVGVDAI